MFELTNAEKLVSRQLVGLDCNFPRAQKELRLSEVTAIDVQKAVGDEHSEAKATGTQNIHGTIFLDWRRFLFLIAECFPCGWDTGLKDGGIGVGQIYVKSIRFLFPFG